MSRLFDGVDDFITFAAGGIAANDGGPSTIVALWRPLAVSAGGIYRGYNAGATGIWGINPFSDNTIYWATNNGFAADNTAAYNTTDGWYITAAGHAADGAAITWSRYIYNTTTWTHATSVNTPGDTNLGPIASFQIGRNSGSEFSNMRMAAFGIWGSVLSTPQREGLTANLSAWSALTPQLLLAFNQANVSDPVLDLTGNGGNQSAITGTTVSGDEPSPWSYGGGAARTSDFFSFF